MKNIKNDDIISEKTYIPLETSNDVLLDKDAVLAYVSDKRMLVFNRKLGDIFIFGMNGKILFKFNRRGPDAYFYINSVVYDEKNKEVFILDNSSRKIFVFNEEGGFLRTLRIINNIRPTEIYNYDDQTIMIFDEKQYINTTPVIRIKPTQPFTVHSKKDGTLETIINITMDKVLAKNLTFETGPNSANTIQSVITLPNNKKFGHEFILHDFSLDTIYHLKADKSLEPLFVQSPSVFSASPKIVSVGFLSNNFVYFSMYNWDLLEHKRCIEKKLSVKFFEKYFVYDLIERKFYQTNLLPGEHNMLDIEKNYCASLVDAYFLINLLKLGRLNGELKQIAQNLNEEDNQVVELLKYK